MTVYFNNDLTPCNNKEKADGVETRLYFVNELNVQQRLDDCLDGYPEISDNAAAWKLIPESCTDDYVYEEENN